MREVPAVHEVSYLTATGANRFGFRAMATTALASGIDRSSGADFAEAPSGGQTAFSSVYFRNQSEPYMSIGVPEPAPGTRRDGGGGQSEADLGRRVAHPGRRGWLCLRRG